MAAIAAGRAGAQVTLLERLPRPGLKLLVTGGGRCNLTNTLPAEEFMRRCGRQGRFMAPALSGLDQQGLCRFFAQAGVPTHAVDGLHVFPRVESAQTVLDALLRQAQAAGVTLRCGAAVTALQVGAGQAGTTVCLGSGDAVAADAVVLAAGGQSYPQLGADGGGFALAAALGHVIVPPVPALVPLLTREDWPRSCRGVTLPRVRVRIDAPREREPGREGELLFTHRGLSGPAILDISGAVAARLATGGEPVPIRVELRPEVPAVAWTAKITTWRAEAGRKLLRTVLDAEFPASLAGALAAAACDGNREVPVCQLSRQQQEKLLDLLTAAPLTVTGTEGYAKAMVTRGGVSLKEIDPESLGSRRVAGLFLAGEVVDLDGPCGGFNLQWAFASGWLAGRSAAASGGGRDYA